MLPMISMRKVKARHIHSIYHKLPHDRFIVSVGT